MKPISKRVVPALALLLGMAVLCGTPSAARAQGTPPAQKLPSALLVFPLVQADLGGTPHDTRVEIVNLTPANVSVHCAYIDGLSCGSTDFFIALTPNQPLSWMASVGLRSTQSSIAVPPFFGSGELKCAVQPLTPDLSSHNALQGRALVTTSSARPETIGYTAIGFRRLTPGFGGGTINLDGIDYEQCPDRLHFNVLGGPNRPGFGAKRDSEILLVPCSEDVIIGPTTTQVLLNVTNEFEQTLSGGLTLTCTARKRFSTFSALRKGTLGSPTGHLVVRGVGDAVIGLVIDRFKALGRPSVSSNEPYLEGGRSASITLP